MVVVEAEARFEGSLGLRGESLDGPLRRAVLEELRDDLVVQALPGEVLPDREVAALLVPAAAVALRRRPDATLPARRAHAQATSVHLPARRDLPVPRPTPPARLPHARL